MLHYSSIGYALAPLIGTYTTLQGSEVSVKIKKPYISIIVAWLEK